MDIDTYDTVHVWLRWMLRYMIMVSMNDIDTWIRVYIWWCICMTGNNEYVVMYMIVVWTDLLVYNMIIRLTETDKYDLLIWVVDITGLVMAYMISEERWTWYVMYVYGLWWTSMVLCVKPALRGNDIDNMICLMQCDICFLCVIIWGKGFIHWASRSPPTVLVFFRLHVFYTELGLAGWQDPHPLHEESSMVHVYYIGKLEPWAGCIIISWD